MHVTTPQVGGGFGGKAGLHPEYTVVAAAARALGRPVVWVPTRSEDMQTLPHSRGQVQYAEVGCRRDGTFTGLRVRLVGDAGAYPTVGAFLPGGTRRMSHGTYDFPAIQFDVAVAITNTTPMGAYRGAGRPEATALLERLVDHAALELGIDPIELRERNLLADDVFPFQTLTGNTYDSGAYRLPLRTAAEAIGYDELRAEQAARRANGGSTLLGIGVAVVRRDHRWRRRRRMGRGAGQRRRFGHRVRRNIGARPGSPDRVRDARLRPDRDPGRPDHARRRRHRPRAAGRRHRRIAVAPARRIGRAQGHRGGGRQGESARGNAARGRRRRHRRRRRDGHDRRRRRAGVGDAVGRTGRQGARRRRVSVRGARRPTSYFDQGAPTFPFGAHIAVVEVDAETGEARLIRHVAVDDCGTVLNPLLVEGQQHGGIASGVGQALYEEVRFDTDGNPITSNFADYAVPSAAELPSFDARSTETPSPLNPLGAKGIGEASTIGSTPAVQNAVIDALAHLGVRHIDMPCTPERVWAAIREARAGTLPDPWREPPAVFSRTAVTDAPDEAAIDAAEGI